MDTNLQPLSLNLLEMERRQRDERRHDVSPTRRNVAFWSVAGLLAPGVAFAFRRNRRTAWLAALGAAAAAALFRSQFQRWFVEEPTYAVEGHFGDIEVRRYEPVIVATTNVEAHSFRDALDVGFRRLARYIFGGNVVRERLSMTAPVTHHERRIAMTSPVVQTARGAHRFSISFTMPKGRTLESLPRPLDARVLLHERPSRRVAALRYSGSFSGEVAERKQTELLEKVHAAGMVPVSAPKFAGYDPPWVLPFLRRNEALVETKTLDDELR